MLSNPLDVDYRVEDGEIRIRQVGETSEGRILAVVTTERGESIRVVTAYPASPSLRSAYAKHKELWLYGEAGST